MLYVSIRGAIERIMHYEWTAPTRVLYIIIMVQHSLIKEEFLLLPACCVVDFSSSSSSSGGGTRVYLLQMCGCTCVCVLLWIDALMI